MNSYRIGFPLLTSTSAACTDSEFVVVRKSHMSRCIHQWLDGSNVPPRELSDKEKNEYLLGTGALRVLDRKCNPELKTRSFVFYHRRLPRREPEFFGRWGGESDTAACALSCTQWEFVETAPIVLVSVDCSFVDGFYFEGVKLVPVTTSNSKQSQVGLLSKWRSVENSNEDVAALVLHEKDVVVLKRNEELRDVPVYPIDKAFEEHIVRSKPLLISVGTFDLPRLAHFLGCETKWFISRERILERAQHSYEDALRKLFDIVYEESVRIVGIDGQKHDKPFEQWSYAACCREVSFSCGQSYTNTVSIIEHSRPAVYTNMRRCYEQSNVDHRHNREEFNDLICTQFPIYLARIDAVLRRIHQAARSSGAPEEFLNANVRMCPRDAGGPLQQRLDEWVDKLECQRWLAVMDAADWLFERIRQVDATIDSITRKTGKESLRQRLERMEEHSELKVMLGELALDVEMFRTWCHLHIQGARSKCMKDRIRNQCTRIERLVVRAQQKPRRMLKLLNVGLDRLDRIAEKRMLVEKDLLRLGPVFTQVAEGLVAGISAEGEYYFWQNIADIFEDAVPYRSAGSTEAQHELHWERLRELNQILCIYDKRNVNGTMLAVLSRGVPYCGDRNRLRCFDDIVYKARDDAEHNGRRDLCILRRILGKDFCRVVLAALGEARDTSWYENLYQLASTVMAKEEEAIAILMNEHGFKALLGSRCIDDLDWRAVADQTLLKRVRTKLRELLGFGSDSELSIGAVWNLLYTSTCRLPVDNLIFIFMDNNTTPSTMGPRLLTPDEVASQLTVSLTTVYRMVQRRSIPFYRVARCLRFHQQDIDVYLQNSRTEAMTPDTYGRSQAA